MSPAEIQQLIHSYRTRGELSRRTFSEQRGMTPSALDYYLRRYGRRPAKTQLARVELKPPDPYTFTLVLANGRRIECPETGLPTLIRIAETL